MKKRIYYILTIILCLMGGAATTYAQTEGLSPIEHTDKEGNTESIYVIYVSPVGSATNLGDSWKTAKNDLQTAIDVLNEISTVKEGKTRGYVFVAGSNYNAATKTGPTLTSVTYKPTSLVSSSNTSPTNKSFCIYPNIYVIGGFKGDETVPKKGDADYDKTHKYCEWEKDLPKMRWLNIGTADSIRSGDLMNLHDDFDEGGVRSWDFKYKSILSGNHHTNTYSFKYDEKRGVYNTTYPLSSYHVVWFGTADTINPAIMKEYRPKINTGFDSDTAEVGGIYYTLDSKTLTATVTKSPDGEGHYSGKIVIPSTITIPKDTTYKVKSIRNGAFYRCDGVDTVIIGNNVTTIETAAFDSCVGLKSVTFGTGLTHIMRFAFYGCTKLDTIVHRYKNDSDSLISGFPSSIKLIDRWSFAYTKLSAKTAIPATINYIGRYAFKDTGIDTKNLPVYEKEEAEMTGRYKGLPFKSKVAGFTIEGGNANSTNLIGHDHTGFGGGVYMVRNTEIEDCIIHHCSATQRGGGVYLDGGGDVNYCYIHTCQSAGFGMQQGYGGGVCIDYDGQVEHCYIIQCAARAGAGLAICHDPDEYPEETSPMADPTFYDTYKDKEDMEATTYDPFAKSTIVANCTSSAEAAGVYLNYGGSLDHLTVVNNECIGPDVIYYGMRHGRTGGIYVREAGAVYNSAVWGNKCRVNSDIQFAAFKKEDYYFISVDHSAFSKGDISDWSAVIRNAVINLNDKNFPDSTFNTGNFPMFAQPTCELIYKYQKGENGRYILDDKGQKKLVEGDYLDTIPLNKRKYGIQHENGVVDPTLTHPGEPYQDPFNWHPLGMSNMRGKGKQIVDVTIATRAELQHANADRDLLGIKFESVSVCGAVTNTYHRVTFKKMPTVETVEGRIAGEDSIPTLFVDPNMVAKSDKNGDGVVGYDEDEELGYSWEHPLNNLQDAVFYFSQYLVDPIDTSNCTSKHYANPAKSYYRLPVLDGEGNVTKDGEGNIIYANYPNVQILMKEGSTNVAGRGAYLTGHIRTAAVRPVSKMRLYGGYSSEISGEDITGRQPYKYKTEVRADVTGGDFNDHSVHVFSLANMHDIIIDGFHMIGGNGNIAKPDPAQMSDSAYRAEMAFYSSVANGGGLAMNNSNETFPRDMTGNILRNCVIANCAAPEGAGIFVNGDAEHGSAGRKCKAELTVVNTVIRNCTAGDTWDNPDRYLVTHPGPPTPDEITNEGVCTANGSGAKIIFRNCDVVNNCGFPFKCTPIDMIPITPGDSTYGGKLTREEAEKAGSDFKKIGNIEVYNSVVFCNGLRVHADRTNISGTVFSAKESWYNVTGEYIYMGWDVLLPEDIIAGTDYSVEGLEERLNSKHIYRILTHNKSEDHTKKGTRIVNGDQQGTTGGPEVEVYYPEFVNPSRNVGHSTTDDKSLYGGAVNYEPLPINPIVNAAKTEKEDTISDCLGYDISLGTRDYGGDPDIGAIETQRLPKAETVLYVTPDGSGDFSGKSWANAIAGNTIYQVPGVDGPELYYGDSKDDADRILDSSSNPRKTTDPMYRGGFARKYEYFMFKDTIRQVVSNFVERIGYIGGDSVGTYDTITPPSPSFEPIVKSDSITPWHFNASLPEGSGYNPSVAYDSRYPYGELSGYSRSMYRAAGNVSPYNEVGTWDPDLQTDFEPNNTPATLVSRSQVIVRNARTEKYVSGLQYAVEKASKLNKSAHDNKVQVWVGAGKYSDYKGFIMRDSVTVMGGFPTGKYATPSEKERVPLLSDPSIVSIPKSVKNKDLDAADYETILQISDTNPKASETAIDSKAILFKDDSASIKWRVKIASNDTIVRVKTHYRKWILDTIDVSRDYIRYPDMIYSGTNNVFSHKNPNYRHKTDKTGASNEGGWSWIANEKYVYQYWGDQGGGNNSWELVYANRENNVDWNNFKFDGKREVIDESGKSVGEVSHGMELTGGMSKMSAWQTMKSVPAGNYILQIDLAAFYRQMGGGNGYDVEEENTGVTFYIIASNDSIVAEQPIFVKNTTTPYKLRRYTFEFSLPDDRDLTIRLMSAPGTKTVDPAGLNSKMPALNINLNRREVLMANVKLSRRVEPHYANDHVETDSVSVGVKRKTYIERVDIAKPSKGRNTLRKRVLSMPDVTNPVYAHGLGNPTERGTLGDSLSHYERTTKEERKSNAKDSNGKSQQGKHDDPNYVEYQDAYWDGFTIRHGFIYDQCMVHGGGAGVAMYEGGHLANCIITDNWAGANCMKGGGVFVDGSDAVVENCFILNNTSTKGTKMEQIQEFAGGLFLYEGTCFNSLIANNYAHGFGGGLGLCVGKFYNNTVAYNTGEKTPCVGGVRIASGAASAILMANSIIYGNNGLAIDMTDKSDYAPFLHCYIQSKDSITKTAITHAIYPHRNDTADGNYGIGNTFWNGHPANDKAKTPFLADISDSGEYSGDAKTKNDFALRQAEGLHCINGGTEDFLGALEEALAVATTSAIKEDKRKTYRETVDGVELPPTDVVFADRVQDCRVDIGAYEYDGTIDIQPKLYPEKNQAVFYVTQNGLGSATATDPDNAACAVKLQKVLDAAGRWRFATYWYDYVASQENYPYEKEGYSVANDIIKLTQDKNNFDSTLLRQEIEAAVPLISKAKRDSILAKLKDYEVIVKLEGDSLRSFEYGPTRSSIPGNGGDNVLQYSLMVPHGVRVEGGYEVTFEKPRDILGYSSYFDGIVGSEGGKAYHVVTFTDDLYTEDEELYDNSSSGIHGQLAFLSDTTFYYPKDATPVTQEEKAPYRAKVENNRAVLDGLFILNGNANGSDEEQQNGAAAIVTDFAHIRNCVIQDNNATGCGGGLYLDSRALVSGCIIKHNTAKYGAGIYVFEPDGDAGTSSNIDTYAHILSSTIANNTATVSAGGLFFATNVRANSLAIWHNNANENPNVAGTDATGMTQLVENYPMNYCGVESRRMAGVNNIELPAEADFGVRWNRTAWYETTTSEGQSFFPITLASVLTRTGMPYSSYEKYKVQYPTLELTDIFGLNRLAQVNEDTLVLATGDSIAKEKKDNDFIEIGARVLNADFQVKLEFEHVMTRLFVTTTERLPTEKAVALQENTVDKEIAARYKGGSGAPGKDNPLYKAIEDTVKMYNQMGSCFLNPMLRVGDALDYIVRVRKAKNETFEKDGYRITIAGDTIEKEGGGYPDKTYKSVADVYKDVRFEIFICGGTFYPYRDAYGDQGESRANTFVVPEKVTIVGGINHEAAGRSYCQEGYVRDSAFTRILTLLGDTLNGATTYEIRTIRDHMDRNGNNVDEPWEMEEQTILSGAAVQNDAKANVYHVITCLSNTEQVGLLPTRWKSDSVNRPLSDTLVSVVNTTGLDPSNEIYTLTLLNAIKAETQTSCDERTIIIDGVTITGGYANKIDVSDAGKNAQALTYFRGGGILVEGNWTAAFDTVGDLPEVLGVAKRDIPLILTSCLIKDNVAGNGGGVYTNGTIYNFGCHYTQNLAIGPVTDKDTTYIPWTAGGAIATNYECHIWNTLFDNNEARRGAYPITKGDITNADHRQGYGGVISSSETSLVRACNCDFVRNKAVAFPAIYNFIDNNLRGQASYGAAVTDSVLNAVKNKEGENGPHYKLLKLQQEMYRRYGSGWHFAVNSIFWGNQATGGDTVASATGFEKSYYDQIYGAGWKDNRAPRHVANFAPHLDVATLTFCSYQEETGRQGTLWWNNRDNAKSAPLKPKTYADAGELDGLTRLYAGRFTDVLDEYFGYYKDGEPDYPYYVTDTTTKMPVPSRLDSVDLKYKGENVYGEGKINHSIYDDKDENTIYTLAMDTLDAVAYNYNLVLSAENKAEGGPYFVQPSLTAGVDGYMETANWLVSRLNNTIDTGWGFLKQNVTQANETTGLFDTKLLKTAKDSSDKPIKNGTEDRLIPVGYYLYTEDPDGAIPDSIGGRHRTIRTNKKTGIPIDTVIIDDKDTILIPVDKKIVLPAGKHLKDTTFTWVKVSEYIKKDIIGKDTVECIYTIERKSWSNLYQDVDAYTAADTRIEEQYHDLFGEGFYNIHSKNIHLRFHDIGYPNLLPIGDDTYMTYVHEGETESLNMRRISTHPKMGVQDVFIDMGIYEYQYVQLITSGDEVDVIWVGPEGKTIGGDGSSCDKATTDLQFAIETLLRSRNDHDKMIKMIGGTYSPLLPTNNQSRAFFIEVPSRTDGITLPKTLTADETHSVKSLTIRGGYPSDVGAGDGESYRNIEAYPVELKMTYEMGSDTAALSHLFVIEDAGEKGCYMNYLTNTNKDFKDNVMPIVLDGLTFVNPYGGDGAAIYYSQQYKRKPVEGTNDFEPDMNSLLKPVMYKVAEDTVAVPKLIIKDCIIKASGRDTAAAAVKINEGGGPSLIVNTVFHSNSGSPLKALNTKVVNCTFALNGGHICLTDSVEKYPKDTINYPSGLYNSIIWKDDLAQDSTKKVQWGGALDTTRNMSYNTLTEWDKVNKEWKTPNDTTKEDCKHNILLHADNKNVFLGPNFVDPVGRDTITKETASTAEKLLSLKCTRDFHINPSARLINKADTVTYRRYVPFYAEQSVIKEITEIEDGDPKTRMFQSVQRLDRPKKIAYGNDSVYWTPDSLEYRQMKGDTTSSYLDPTNPYQRRIVINETREGELVDVDTMSNELIPHKETELAFKNRWHGYGMERGAYECAAALQRVLYVKKDPGVDEDGSSWNNSFGGANLQKAIDVAAIFSIIEFPRKRAYVFVKNNDNDYGDVVMRDGVSVYGGIKTGFGNEAGKTDGEYTENDIRRYINLVNATREPVAISSSASTINGLKPDDNAAPDPLGFMVDGFKLSAGDTTNTPFNLEKQLTVVKNCLITGNNVLTEGLPVIKIDKGLLYNSLVYGNTADTIVKISDDSKNAGVLNCTVVADHTGEVAIASSADSSVVNTITYNEAEKTSLEKALSRRGENDEAFVKCNTDTVDMFAPYLRAGRNDYSIPTEFTNMRPLWYQLVETSTYINGGQAKDVTIGTESKPTIFYPYKDFINYTDIATADGLVGLAGDRDPLGNPRLVGRKPDIGCFETWKVDTAAYLVTNKTDTFKIDNYGGHKYPHEGSVVYVMEKANLVVDKEATFNSTNPLSPGYVLVKDSGSIYGQGNYLKFSYVAAERNFPTQQFMLVAMPFDILHKSVSLDAFAYSGATRSTYNYQFLNENSTAWVKMSDTIKACEGWLADLGESFPGGIIRFTGWGKDRNKYVYSEGGDSLIVKLTQYDHREPGIGSSLNFTRAEDMGWNLKGLPYLVTNYRTDDPMNESGDPLGEDYNMNIPHIFYVQQKSQYIDSSSIVPALASWEYNTTLSHGYGFFTQTATLDTVNGEDLVFKVPTYSGKPAIKYAPARPIVLMRDLDNEGDLLTVNPDEGAPKTINYSLGRDGVKWMMTDAPQLYLLSAAKSRLSLLGAAPTEVDIPLGVSVPEAPRYQDMPRYFTFSLPEPEAFEDYEHVWLIDKALNRVTNLVDQTYAAALSPGTDNSRFYLRIGGFPFGNDQRREYIVYAWKRQLHIRGLIEGDQIRVYSLTGQLILSTTARDPEFTAELPQAGGVYAVRVNDFSTKVRNL